MKCTYVRVCVYWVCRMLAHRWQRQVEAAAFQRRGLDIELRWVCDAVLRCMRVCKSESGMVGVRVCESESGMVGV